MNVEVRIYFNLYLNQNQARDYVRCTWYLFFKLYIEDYNLQYVQYTRKNLQNCSDHQFN